ncbi:MAG: hypothetical protein HDT11_00185 [Helicobacter sp.]|nr:hypothetical protein [Helicobacter sp.]MBD5167305.1 hypothetical protein [Helicobacter sp.]MDE6045199.1 hypothetical protein [Helicobacter sp.]
MASFRLSSWSPFRVPAWSRRCGSCGFVFCAARPLPASHRYAYTNILLRLHYSYLALL